MNQYRELRRKWFEEHPHQAAPTPDPWMLQVWPKSPRAPWALHLVQPGMIGLNDHLYGSHRALTHLTITLYDHFIIGDDPSFDEVLERILSRRFMPLLQHLHIRCINFGTRIFPPTREESDPYGFEKKRNEQAKKQGEEAEWETDSDDAKPQLFDMQILQLEDHHEWIYRKEDVKDAVTGCGDERVTFEAIKLEGSRAKTLMEDVRKYTLSEWSERVHYGRAGPWKNAMTENVRIDVPSDSDQE